MSLSRRARLKIIFFSVLATLASTSASSNAADEKKVCAIAAEQAQRLKNDHKYRDARDQLLICTRSVCPSFVKSDCEPWLAEVEKATPTVVVGAKDQDGADVMDVRVLVDGVVVAEKLDGSAISIDPGTHRLRFERSTGTVDPVEQSITVTDGEKLRKVGVAFVARVAVPKPGEVPPDTKGPPRFNRPAPIGAYVASGVALVGLGVGGYFYLSAKSDIDDLKGTCAPHCDGSRVDPVNTKIIVSDIALGLGVVAAATAVTFFILHATSTPISERMVKLVAPSAGGSGLSIHF